MSYLLCPAGRPLVASLGWLLLTGGAGASLFCSTDFQKTQPSSIMSVHCQGPGGSVHSEILWARSSFLFTLTVIFRYEYKSQLFSIEGIAFETLIRPLISALTVSQNRTGRVAGSLWKQWALQLLARLEGSSWQL